MEQNTIRILFALLRSAICGTQLTDEERDIYSPDLLRELLKISSKHDVTHLVALGLKQNKLVTQETAEIEKYILKAVYRHERMNYEYEKLCSALEEAQIPFLPLKGAVLREYYPEAWMRTSCDIDVLIHRKDLDRAIACLTDTHSYQEKERATHDVGMLSPSGVPVELHFDLVEEGRAQDAVKVLRNVWEHTSLHENSRFRYDMSDELFYFYHIAHMAKHFENGGCGIRPFLDLWLLDHREKETAASRNAWLERGKLLKFADAARTLSEVWFGEKEPNTTALQMQEFLLRGGVYGSTDNRIAIQQKKRGGRWGYVVSRVFIPYAKLKRYYPVLERYPFLTPILQVRRWFMLLNPKIARMAKAEMASNGSLDKAKAEEMNAFLDQMGLC